MSKNTIQGTDAGKPENTPSPALGADTGSARSAKQPPDPESAPFDMNAVIGWILQGGVLISAAVICVGLALSLLHPEQLSSEQFLVFPHTLGQVKDGLLALHPQAFITLGLLLLIATPVVRVAASIFAFALEHDRRYVVITTIVLAILLTSFLLGKGAG